MFFKKMSVDFFMEVHKIHRIVFTIRINLSYYINPTFSHNVIFIISVRG